MKRPRLRCQREIVRVLAPVSPEMVAKVAAAANQYVLVAG